MPNRFQSQSFWLRTVALFITTMASSAANANIVALDIDLPLDQAAPGLAGPTSDSAGPKIGEHHRARIFYDDTTIDPKTHIVRVIHMEHLWITGPEAGTWAPDNLGDASMPMTDAWLDLGSKPYRYHYKSSIKDQGYLITVNFDEKKRRLTIRKVSDNSVLISAPYTIDPTPIDTVGLKVAHKPVLTTLNMTVKLDQVAAGQASKVGDVDNIRITYDASAVNPVTKRVPLLNFQHFYQGRWLPPVPDATFMPTTDSWLDTSVVPYSLHYRASVVHGAPIIIEVNESTRRLSILSQLAPANILESGAYDIDPTPMTGPEAIAAGTPSTVPWEHPPGSL